MLVEDALRAPDQATSYLLHAGLRRMLPDLKIWQVDSVRLDVFRYVAKHPDDVECVPRDPQVLNQTVSTWRTSALALRDHVPQGLFEVRWRGARFELLVASWREGSCNEQHFFMWGDDALIEAFVREVGVFTNAIGREIMVFRRGYWSRDHELWQEARQVSFDDLILADGLSEAIREDVDTFFASQADYARYGIAWKRGVLLLGPPGNGKTMTIKALLQHVDVPCFYVRSIASDRSRSDHDNIHRVFERVRAVERSMLVLEDLDTMVTRDNLSFFLNELDGFSSNEGVLCVASTNHPERLDPALLHRPSRFDRKFTFELPDAPTRVRYLSLLNGRLDAELALDDDAISELAQGTEGFTFAYLKELFVSGLMLWMQAPHARGLAALLRDHLSTLREEVRLASQAQQQEA